MRSDGDKSASGMKIEVVLFRWEGPREMNMVLISACFVGGRVGRMVFILTSLLVLEKVMVWVREASRYE